MMDYQYNRKLALACGLLSIPCRRTFDRRLKTISTDMKERISTMGYLFVVEGLVDLSITAIDSTLLKAKGGVWHKSSMKKEKHLVQASIQMQDGGDTVIQKDGYLDINYTLHQQQQQQQEKR